MSEQKTDNKKSSKLEKFFMSLGVLWGIMMVVLIINNATETPGDKFLSESEDNDYIEMKNILKENPNLKLENGKDPKKLICKAKVLGEYGGYYDKRPSYAPDNVYLNYIYNTILSLDSGFLRKAYKVAQGCMDEKVEVDGDSTVGDFMMKMAAKSLIYNLNFRT